MPAREIREGRQLLGQHSSGEDDTASSSAGSSDAERVGDGRRWRGNVGKLLTPVLALVAAVLCIKFGVAYYHGSAAADAAFETYQTYALQELELPFSEQGVAELMDRAGRGPQQASDLEVVSGTDASLYPEIDEAVSVASESQKMQDQGSGSGGASSAQANLDALNELVRTEINKALEEQQENLNDNMYALVSSQMQKAKFPRTSQMVVDGFEGLESFYIDEMECYKVDSDLTTMSARAYLRIKGHAGTLTGHIRVRPGKSGSFYRIVLKIYGFWVVATPSIDIDFMTQAITSAKVGWIRVGFSSMDGTCYSKTNPSQKDGLCTSILMKKLREKKASALHQISAKASREVQAAANKFLPFKMPKKPSPPTTPPTTTVPNTTTGAMESTTAPATMAAATTMALTTALPTTVPATTTSAPATSVTTTVAATTAPATTTTTTARATTTLVSMVTTTLV
eukprot:TRINITY_DN359_c0_g3_i1.p1 TRINITY_DN359_c0_g3~~TRINITY_DN359_c0_g3_i1.p1  ORF type:complete len:481 (+),score=104.35 TRINITY_DN359_c0_g3_i1:80-1444(+)